MTASARTVIAEITDLIGACGRARHGGPFALAGRVEVSVDRARDDGALTDVVELLGERDLLGVELRASAALAAAGAGGRQPVAGVGDDELALQLWGSGRPQLRLATE